MGKRDKGENSDNVKTKRKKTHHTVEAVVEISNNIKSTGNGKNKKIVFENEESSESIAITKTQNEITEQNSAPLPKRNMEKTVESTAQSENKDKQNRKKFLDDVTETGIKETEFPDEKEPQDDEIDKFCDELDEEDNVQYENWVKLIEAKLCPNKKK